MFESRKALSNNHKWYITASESTLIARDAYTCCKKNAVCDQSKFTICFVSVYCISIILAIPIPNLVLHRSKKQFRSLFSFNVLSRISTVSDYYPKNDVSVSFSAVSSMSSLSEIAEGKTSILAAETQHHSIAQLQRQYSHCSLCEFLVSFLQTTV